MFNLWYCNKVFQKPKTATKQLTIQSTEKKTAPTFNNTKKIILILAVVFLLASMLAQLGSVTKL